MEKRYKITHWDNSDLILHYPKDLGEIDRRLQNFTASGLGIKVYECIEEEETNFLSEWEIIDWNCDLDTGIINKNHETGRTGE